MLRDAAEAAERAGLQRVSVPAAGLQHVVSTPKKPLARKSELGASMSAPALRNTGGKAPKGRGEAGSFGPVVSGKWWGSCNFDKMYMAGKL